MKKAEQNLSCFSCGKIIFPNEQYVGFKRPHGMEILCTICYVSKYGEIKNIKTRVPNGAPAYEENKKRLPRLKYGEHRRSYLEPEEVHPEEIGGGWMLVGRFFRPGEAKSVSDNFESEGFITAVSPVRARGETRPGSGFKIPMWGVFVKDITKVVQPEMFSEEWWKWMSAGKEVPTFEVIGGAVTPETNPLNRIPYIIAKMSGYKGNMTPFIQGLNYELGRQDYSLLEAAQVVIVRLQQYPMNYSGSGIEEMVDLAEVNPKPTRIVKVSMELQKGQLGSLSIGMLYRVRDVILNHKPTTYQPAVPDADNPVYYLLPGERGVVITDNIMDGKRTIEMVVPYEHYRRVEEIIKNIEDYVKYKGETKELTARFIFHRLYPEAEPEIYTTRPPTEKSKVVGVTLDGATGGFTFVEGFGYTPWLNKHGVFQYGDRTKSERTAYWWLVEHGIPVDPDEFEIKPPHESSEKQRRTIYSAEGDNLVGVLKSKDTGIRPFIQRGMIRRFIKHEIVGYTDEPCTRCSATGKMVIECSSCGGTGTNIDPKTITIVACGKCHGSKTETTNCSKCYGDKIIKTPKYEEVFGMVPDILLGPVVKYLQQAIEWLVKQGLFIPAEPISVEVRDGPQDVWRKAEHISGEDIPTTITPLWDDSMGPPPTRHRRERLPPTTIIPLTEGNPIGAIGTALLTGLAAGAASGVAVGAISAVGRESEQNRGKKVRL
jgi:hypothetical protein